MIREAIKTLVERGDLSINDMEAVVEEIMEGKVSDILIASFLTALKMKGETVEEITGAARAMRKKSEKINAPEGSIDTCGTGGDMSGTFNISTTSAIVVAATGIPVAKHGNVSVSSRSGSADLLRELGINIELKPSDLQRCLEETGFGFLFAPIFHPAMRYVSGVRKELGMRTIFNLLGPVTNPAFVKRQVVGVYAPHLTEVIGEVLKHLGVIHAFVVHSEEGLDEISICGRTKIIELKNGTMETYYITPEDIGLKRAHIRDIMGGDAKENAKITLSILRGERGPKRDAVLINAAAAIVVSGKAEEIAEGLKMAEESIDSGSALKKLQEIGEVTNRLAKHGSI
ncbi:MAG: anthranilate phosphoribosyltransferase [Nitrospirae bacterium]|nr:MAG: anthranilate phosphoribosyltransferase [Nitrospirota bacterium]